MSRTKTEDLSPSRSWVPWWQSVNSGEELTLDITFDAPGEFGVLVGPGGATWDFIRSTTSGRIILTLPATFGGVWRIGLTQTSGFCKATVKSTITANKTPQRSLTQQVSTLPPGTVVENGGADDSPLFRIGYPDGGVYGPESEIKRVVSGAPLDPDSAAKIQYMIDTNLTPYYGGVAGVNAYQYGTPVYIVDERTPTQTVGFVDYQNKKYVPGQLYEGGHFKNIRIPAEARPAPGTDAQMTIAEKLPDGSWSITELWQARYDAVLPNVPAVSAADADAGVRTLKKYADKVPGWSAVWGGKTNTKTIPGGWYADGMGSSATGVVTSAYSIGVEEVLAGEIKHAISLVINYPAIWWKFSYPAQRSDGNDNNPLAIQEGQRLVMDPTVDFSTHPGLTPFARLVGKAAQKYGFILTDKSGSVAVICEDDSAHKRLYGVNRWDTIFGNTKTYELLRNFPWNKLRVLPVNYGKP